MFSSCFLPAFALALLLRDVSAGECGNYEVKTGKDSAVMDSLQCYNDFKSYVECTWEDNLPANISIDALRFWDKAMNKRTRCSFNRNSVPLSNGKTSHTCRYKTKRFNKEINHTLFFKMPCESTTLKLAEQGKVRAPVEVSETEAGGGDRLLSWRSPYPQSSNITSTLVYQLQYRTRTQDWTTVDNISELEHKIDKGSLLPGFHYEARVRARGRLGLWSDWSPLVSEGPLVSWRTDSDGDFNLQCLIEDDRSVACTWQMKTDYVPFMFHQVWCSDGDDTARSVCCEKPQLVSSSANLSEFTCSVETADPYALTVELRPVKYIRQFSTSENIKLPKPEIITAVEEDGFLYLNWSMPEVAPMIEYNTEIKINSSEILNTFYTENSNNYQIPTPQLSTDYWAQIRFVDKPGGEFEVHPSDWSESVAFTTNKDI